jgi:transposase
VLRAREFSKKSDDRESTHARFPLGIARFAAQKRPQPTRLSDQSAQELRHIVHLRERTIQHLGDRVRDLHRAIDLTFPEFTRHIRGLDTELATAILTRYPTADAVLTATVGTLAAICFDGRRRVGQSLARSLISAAQTSVGQHQTEPYERQVRYACQDILAMCVRARELETDIHHRLEHDEVGKLLTTIQGISTLTAAVIVAEAGNPARFRNAAAFASYVGVIPRMCQSGKRTFSGKGLVPLGNARLRHALWMPVLVGIRVNRWLRAHYQRLRGVGKRPKVAMIACMHKLLAAIYSVARNRRPFVVSDG